LKDKFGVSWQIVPKILGEMLQDKDTKKSESHGGIASNEDNRHTGLDEGIRRVVALRKLKLQVQMSVDDYIAGPKGKMDWIISNWDDKLKTDLFHIDQML
jgi:hypothetical protein